MTNDEGLDFARSRRSGLMVDITMVERGLACDCVCDKCGATLQAKKGPKNRHHFAHHVDGQPRGTCDGGRESALHKAAIQIIADWKYIELPDYRVREGGFEELLPGGLFQITRSEKPDARESRMLRTKGSAHPDVILHSPDEEVIWCEVKVTHAVDEAKKAKLKKEGVPTLEFDLSRMHQSGGWTLDTLKRALREENGIRSWAFHPEGEKLRQSLRKRREGIDAERLASKRLAEKSRHAEVSEPGSDPWAGLNLQDCGDLVFHPAMGLIPKDPQKRLDFIARIYLPPKTYKLDLAIAYLRVHPHWDSTCLVTFGPASKHGRTSEYDAALSEFARSENLTCSYFGIPDSRQIRGKNCHFLLDRYLTRLQSVGSLEHILPLIQSPDYHPG